MSKNNQNELAASLVATSGQQSSVTEQLAALLQRRFLKEEQDEATRKAEQDEYREQQLQAIGRAMEQRNAMQRMCEHQKPNFSSALNGQRDHQGEFHGVCSYCGMNFTGEDLLKPEYRHLAIAADRVGGPIN